MLYSTAAYRRWSLTVWIALAVLLVTTVARAQPIPSVIEPTALPPLLEVEDVVVLDLRRQNEFRAGHLPGAVSVDPVVESFRRSAESVLVRLPDPAEFAEQMSRLGIANEDRLVLVTRGESWLDMATATDLFWLLKRFGHEQVAVLNGGMRALTQRTRVALVSDAPPRARASYRLAEPRVVPATLASLADAAAVVDARLRGQFLGINKTAAVARYGTIPGARNLPGNWVTIDAGGLLRTAEQLRPILKLTGVPEAGRIVVFGSTPLAGSMVWFALRVTLGNREVRLLDGGMGVWQDNPQNPLDSHVGGPVVQVP